MNWITQGVAILKIALGIVPQVIEIIKAIELPGFGAEKAKAVCDAVVAAFDLLPDEIKKIIGSEKVHAFASAIITIIVTYLNLTGFFKRSTPA